MIKLSKSLIIWKLRKGLKIFDSGFDKWKDEAVIYSRDNLLSDIY